MARRVAMAIALLLCACQAEQMPGAPSNQAQRSETAAPPTEIAAANNAVAAEAGNRSQFTSIETDNCRLLEENLEEGGWWRRLCEGSAGYKLELSDSDLRQDIVVIGPDGRRDELGLSDIVANGAFNSLGKTAEWRGADPGKPKGLIVRLNVASGPDGNRPDISRLVVARLKAPACIVAVVPPGPGQNERARAIADGELPPCLER
jgi:hypothetical protein